jgi:hypothetical protein
MISTRDRRQAVELIDEAVAAGARRARACKLSGSAAGEFDTPPLMSPHKFPPKSSRRRANCWYRRVTLLNLAEEA